MKCYVIFERGFEYNDEIYSEPDSGGGTPKKVFFSKKEAIDEVNRLNASELKGCCLSNYAYDLSDICDISKLQSAYEKFDWKFDDEYLEIPSNATSEQIDEIAKYIDIDFFDYQEVDADMATFRNEQIDNVVK